jgi:hypothetical protein
LADFSMSEYSHGMELIQVRYGCCSSQVQIQNLANAELVMNRA